MKETKYIKLDMAIALGLCESIAVAIKKYIDQNNLTVNEVAEMFALSYYYAKLLIQGDYSQFQLHDLLEFAEKAKVGVYLSSSMDDDPNADYIEKKLRTLLIICKSNLTQYSNVENMTYVEANSRLSEVARFFGTYYKYQFIKSKNGLVSLTSNDESKLENLITQELSKINKKVLEWRHLSNEEYFKRLKTYFTNRHIAPIEKSDNIENLYRSLILLIMIQHVYYE